MLVYTVRISDLGWSVHLGRASFHLRACEQGLGTTNRTLNTAEQSGERLQVVLLWQIHKNNKQTVNIFTAKKKGTAVFKVQQDGLWVSNLPKF